MELINVSITITKILITGISSKELSLKFPDLLGYKKYVDASAGHSQHGSAATSLIVLLYLQESYINIFKGWNFLHWKERHITSTCNGAQESCLLTYINTVLPVFTELLGPLDVHM